MDAPDSVERGRLPVAPPFLTLAGLAIAGSWLAGTFCASLGFQVPFLPVLTFAIVAAIAVLLSGRYQLLLIPVAISVLYLGADRYYQYISEQDVRSSVLAEQVGSEVIVAGAVSEAAFDRHDQTRLRIEVDEIEDPAGPIPAGGSLVAWVYRDVGVGIGDSVEIQGRLERPVASDAFDPASYLRVEDVVGLMRSATVLSHSPAGPSFRSWLGRIRASASRRLDRYLPEPSAGLARGVLLGERGGFDRDLRDSFARTGLMHLIAISGLNMVLVSGLIVGPCRRTFGANVGVAVAIAAIAFYALLVVPAPSVYRAAVMSMALLVADRLGRPADGLTLLALSGGGMVLHRPTIVHDAGFQLSFAAAAGIILIGPSIQRQLSFMPRFFSYQLSTGLSASWLTLPILIGTFGSFSPWAILAGVVAVPLLSYVIIGSGAVVVAGSIWSVAGTVVAAFAWIPLTLLIKVIEFVDSHTAPVAQFGLAGEPIAAYYLLVAPLTAFLIPDLRERWPLFQLVALLRRLPTVPTLIGLIVVVAVAWTAILENEDQHSTVTLLSDRSEPAAIIRSSDGRVAVYGRMNRELVGAISRRLPVLRRTIDLLIVDQWDTAVTLPHYRIASERYDVENVLIPIQPPPASEAGTWLNALRNSGTEIIEAETGLGIQIGENEVVTVLAGPVEDRPVIGAIQFSSGTIRTSLLYDPAAGGQLLRTAPYLSTHILHAGELPPAEADELLREFSSRIIVSTGGPGSQLDHVEGVGLINQAASGPVVILLQDDRFSVHRSY